MRSFAAAVSAKPDETMEVVLVYMGGLERAPTQLANPALAFRNEFDGYVQFAPDEATKFAATGDYGIDAIDGGVSFWGVGAYAHRRIESWLSGTVRGEYYADPNGFTSGYAQRLVEGTATLEARGKLGGVNVIARLEFRHDQSDIPAFAEPHEPPSTHQNTLTLGWMASF
jgi:hypothetical protein